MGITEEQPHDPRLAELVSALDGAPEARAAAEQTLRAIGSWVAPDLVALAAYPPLSPRARRTSRLTAALLGGCAAMLVAASLWPSLADLFLIGLIAMAAGFAVDMTTGRGARREAWQWQVRVVRALTLYDDVRVLDPLLRRLETDYLHSRAADMDARLATEDRRAALCHVLRVLGMLPAAEAKERIAIARRAIYESYDLGPETFEKVCDFAVQVRDQSAYAILKPLAHGEAATPRQKRLRAAAQRCLAALEEARQAQREQETLLRPSASADADSAVLMRPAGTTPDASDRLLRPADEDDTT